MLALWHPQREAEVTRTFQPADEKEEVEMLENSLEGKG